MTELKITKYEMPASALGADNPLPDLDGVADAHEAIVVDEATVTPEEARYMGWGRINSILPYTIQDGYNRKRRKRAFKAFVLENTHLKAVFLPEIGGRLWSLFDKDAGRELLHVNPVFQPCNLALRNAWFSGGVEWNVGIIGHTPFTADDMACQLLSFSDGTPVLRMFEYERVRHLFYRVEAFLPEDSRELFVRVRIDNATKEDTAVYWWSNMAVNEGENIRVIVPAQKSFRYGYGGKLAKVQIPYMHAEADRLSGSAARLARKNGGFLDWDISRTMTLPQAMDFFFDIPEGTRPYVAALDETGYGVCQTSTMELRYRKLFVWGMGEGGRHWQEFLSKKGSKYIELQSGLAHTQLEHLPMAGGDSISWMESYGAVKADPKAVHGKEWDTAVNAVSAALDNARPLKTLEDWHARAKKELDGQNGPAVHKGMGFARCEKALLGEAFDTCGLKLGAMRTGREEKPWLTLAKTGVLPCPEPADNVLSYQISPAWENALRESAAKGLSDHWYAHYQLAVMAHARVDYKAARSEYLASLKLERNAWALRGLALIDMKEGNTTDAIEHFCDALSLKQIRPLVVEVLDALMKTENYERMLEMLKLLPAALRNNGRIKCCEVAAQLRTGHLDTAEQLLHSGIVVTDLREGQCLLTDLWFELMALRIKGSADKESIAWAHENLKPPKQLDFRMN